MTDAYDEGNSLTPLLPSATMLRTRVGGGKVIGYFLAVMSGLCWGGYMTLLKNLDGRRRQAFWLDYAIALGIVSVIGAWLMGGNQLFDHLAAADFRLLAIAFFGGTMNGLGVVIYSRSIEYLGLGIASSFRVGATIAISVSVSIWVLGGISPAAAQAVGPLILIWVSILVAGILFCGYANLLKEKRSEGRGAKYALIGIGICLASAAAVACYVWAFDLTVKSPPVGVSLQAYGAFLMMAVGFAVSQLIYRAFELQRSGTWGQWLHADLGQRIRPTLSASFLAIGCLINYKSADFIGMPFAFPIGDGMAILTANLFALFDFQEFKGCPSKCLWYQALGNCLIIGSLVGLGRLLGYAGTG